MSLRAAKPAEIQICVDPRTPSRRDQGRSVIPLSKLADIELVCDTDGVLTDGTDGEGERSEFRIRNVLDPSRFGAAAHGGAPVIPTSKLAEVQLLVCDVDDVLGEGGR